jgi:hypothetical protein
MIAKIDTLSLAQSTAAELVVVDRLFGLSAARQNALAKDEFAFERGLDAFQSKRV